MIQQHSGVFCGEQGTRRSLEHPRRTPAHDLAVESDEPTVFELYAVHSKGVTCISVASRPSLAGRACHPRSSPERMRLE